MKRFLSGIAVLLFGSFALLGFSYSRLSMLGLRQTRQATIDSWNSSGRPVFEKYTALKETAGPIAFAGDAGVPEQRLATAEAELAKMNSDEAGQRTALDRIRRLIEDRREFYFVEGKTVSLEQLQADANTRVAAYDSLKRQILTKEAAIAQLRKSVSTAHYAMDWAQATEQRSTGAPVPLGIEGKGKSDALNAIKDALR